MGFAVPGKLLPWGTAPLSPGTSIIYLYYDSANDPFCRMETVTVSPKFQVVIPRSIREALDIRPGQRVQMIPYEGRIEVVPVPDPREMRGRLRGLSNDFGA